MWKRILHSKQSLARDLAIGPTNESLDNHSMKRKKHKTEHRSISLIGDLYTARTFQNTS